jgi:hypothetical protein
MFICFRLLLLGVMTTVVMRRQLAAVPQQRLQSRARAVQMHNTFADNCTKRARLPHRTPRHLYFQPSRTRKHQLEVKRRLTSFNWSTSPSSSSKAS